MAAGPDGNIWFTELGTNRIGRIAPDGSGLTAFSIPTAASAPLGIAAGPDGALWFAESATNRIGRITTSGVMSEYPLPTFACSIPRGVTVGPDGAIWYADGCRRVGRIAVNASTSNPNVVTYAPPTIGAQPYYLAAGPDRNLWMLE